MARTKNAIASPATPKKTRMTEPERKASNQKHNQALMTLAIEELLTEGYISVMQLPTLLIARKAAND